MAAGTTKKPKVCDRCKELSKVIYYRYPHVFKTKKVNSCTEAVFSILLVFCKTCVNTFDTNWNKMKERNWEDQIKFLRQYRR